MVQPDIHIFITIHKIAHHNPQIPQVIIHLEILNSWKNTNKFKVQLVIFYGEH